MLPVVLVMLPVVLVVSPVVLVVPPVVLVVPIEDETNVEVEVVEVVEVVDDVVVVVVVELLPDPNNQPTRRPFSGPSRMCRPVHNVLLFSTSYTRDRRSMTNSVSSSPVTVVFLAVGASLTAITSMSMSDATQLALLSHMKNENVSGPW